jgi:hypothetical protein
MGEITIRQAQADGQRESRRAELWEELVGSFLPQVCLYHCLESNDYGRILSDNKVYIKDKRVVCLTYRLDSEVIRNYCVGYIVALARGRAWK